MTRARRCLTAAAAISTSLATSTAHARDPGRADVCASAAEAAQDLRSHGRLIASMAQLRTCMDPGCPVFVRRDCAQWANEVETSMPSVVVSARTAGGRDLVQVHVTVDGAPFATSIDGIEKRLDPGAHHFHFETAGAPPVDADVVLREGDKRRAVTAVFVPPPRVPDEPQAQAAGRGPWPWLLGGVGLAAIGIGAGLALFAVSDLHGLQNGCGQSGACTGAEVSPVKTRLWVGDLSMIAGVVAVGVATWVAVRPVPGGAAVQMQGALP